MNLEEYDKYQQIVIENDSLKRLLKEVKDHIGSMPSYDMAKGEDRFFDVLRIVNKIEKALYGKTLEEI